MIYSFKNDYGEGCLPEILETINAHNLEQCPGYGLDRFSEIAKEYIRKKISKSYAEVHFVSGGTQANLLVISGFLRSHEGVVCAETAHINVHETGAIEATGHKVMALREKPSYYICEDLDEIENASKSKKSEESKRSSGEDGLADFNVSEDVENAKSSEKDSHNLSESAATVKSTTEEDLNSAAKADRDATKSIEKSQESGKHSAKDSDSTASIASASSEAGESSDFSDSSGSEKKEQSSDREKSKAQNSSDSQTADSDYSDSIKVPCYTGKIDPKDLEDFLIRRSNDPNAEHMVKPGLVYISQPTELGSLYSKDELKEIRRVCKDHNLPLYIDGARLSMALMSQENDLSLQDLASLCDALLIGGTKCGALFGEALVFPSVHAVPEFRYQMKQRGAMLAKGRLLGIQFATLFRDDLYEIAGKHANQMASDLANALQIMGIPFFSHSRTNQIFPVLPNKILPDLLKDFPAEIIGAAPRAIAETFGQKAKKLRSDLPIRLPKSAPGSCRYIHEESKNMSIVRFVTSWATPKEAVEALVGAISKFLREAGEL